MFQFVGDIVEGGWNAISNIGQSIGKGMESIGSAFFPAPQRTAVKHLQIEQRGGTGQQVRTIAPQGQSIIETAGYYSQDWIDSPYEMQFAVPEKVKESKIVADTVSTKPTSGFDWINQGLDWAMQTSKQVKTIAETWDEATGKKTTSRTTEGQSSGSAKPKTRTVNDLGTFVDRGAEVIENFRKAAENVFGQVKGMFNLGYKGQEKEPVFSIQHELDPGTKIAVGSTGLVIIVVLIILLWSKK